MKASPKHSRSSLRCRGEHAQLERRPGAFAKLQAVDRAVRRAATERVRLGRAKARRAG
jgi:hypothetical protein